MSRGTYTIADCDVAISKHPAEIQKRFGSAQYDMRIMKPDNTARIYPIPKAEAERMAKKIAAFRKGLLAEMMEAHKKFKAGKR